MSKSALGTKAAVVALLILVTVLVAFLLFRHDTPKATVAIASPAKGLTVPRPPEDQSTWASPQASPFVYTEEVCGHGKVSTNLKGIDLARTVEASDQTVGELAKDAEARWLLALQNSGEPRTRAAGLFLQGRLAGGDSAPSTAAQARDAEVQLASSTNDPAIYAMAVSMCDTFQASEPGGACEQLSLKRWAQMDPSNAVPWLLMASRARQQHDLETEADAFAQASNSSTVNSYIDSLYAFSKPGLPPDVTPFERAYLGDKVVGIEITTKKPEYYLAANHCSLDALQGSSVLKECNSLAELMVNKGETVEALHVAKVIGARAGWAGWRLADIDQEINAALEAYLKSRAFAGNKFWSCESVSLLNAYFEERMRLGERGSARALLDNPDE
jgi:hypothetical protein